MGFTFNGITSKSMGIPSRMTVENRIPSLRNSTAEIAGKHGVVDFGSKFSEREIDIECLIPYCKTQAELLALKDKLTGWLNPDSGVYELILDTEPDRVYYARLRDGVSFDRLTRQSASFELPFFCPDPYAYATEDEVFTLTADGIITRTLGNVESHPVYEVRGILANTNRTLTFSVDGVEVTAKGPLADGEVLYIDTDNMTAWIEGTTGVIRNALGSITELNFPYLSVGENVITLSSDNGTFTSLTINAKSRWL